VNTQSQLNFKNMQSKTERKQAKYDIFFTSTPLPSILQNYKRFSYTGAPLSNTLWRRRAKKDVNKVHWTAFSKSKE
jgi:hypothetical protein